MLTEIGCALLGGCVDTFPSRCKDEANICNSNFDMRRFCPKTCKDCGEGIFSLKIYVKPHKKQIA